MNKVNPKTVESWNKTADSDWYMSYRTDEQIQRLMDDPYSAFHPVTARVIRESLTSFAGKKVCVPSSGDNHAVFAFHLLGANVISCDISHRQLEHAKAIAERRGWDIKFVLDNTMTLEKSMNGEYDFVYTSNGVHVWIGDLPSMYGNIYRVLNETGIYIMSEIHPVGRPMADSLGEIKVVKPYDDTGPYEGENGTTYHWRTQDFVNAIAGAGLLIQRMEEMFDYKKDGDSFWFCSGENGEMTPEGIDAWYDWRKNPQAAFPQWISICATK